MDRFKRPMLVPGFVGFFIGAGVWATALVFLVPTGVPYPLLVALLPAGAAAAAFVWFKSRGHVAVLDSGLVVNDQIYPWESIVKVVERFKGSQDSAASGLDGYGGGETYYRHTLWVHEDGVEKVVNVPVVRGSDTLRVEIASRLTEAAFASSTFTTWLERREI